MYRRLTVRMLLCIATVVAGSYDLGAASLVGQSVADFQLRSHRGREWTLNDFADHELVVILFLGTECPLVKLYGPRLAAMHERFKDDGVAFIGINANTQDSMTELTAYAERYKIPFPLLKDVGNRVADAVGAKRTPEVFVLDKDRRVRYHGRIDDQYAVGVSRDKALRNDLSISIEQLLDGQEVSVAETEPVGCLIGRVKQTEPTGEVTYTQHIAGIFNARCVECHRDGEIAPFPLTRYDDVIGWEDTILEVIADQRMPPWFANSEYGAFHNDARLSEEEKSLISKWVENGMPEGDSEHLPTPPDFIDGWRIPKPDQIFWMREQPFQVPAQGVVDYQHYLVDPKWSEDKYIYAAEARPDNTSVVHHILVYVVPPGTRREADLRRVLVGYAPGSTPVRLHNGTAIHVPAGSKLLFQMHYTPNGYQQEDRSYAGICFIDKQDVTTLLSGRLTINTDLRIPANDDNHVVTADYRFRRDEMLISMTPHMHLRGKAFRYEARYPNGVTEILLDVPNYDFNWQLKYILAEPKLIPRGTTLFCTAVYDNSEHNLANPNPNRPVGWGDQSWEEMMIGFFDTVPANTNEKPSLSTNVTRDPSGAWTWQRPVGNATVTESLTLKLDGNRLSGVLNTNGRAVDVQNAVVDGDQLTFHVNLPQFAGMTIDFAAKISQDQLKGQAIFTFESVGKSQTFPWIAKRQAAATEQ